jgi:hypothetical protein
LPTSRAGEAEDLFGSPCYCYGREINHKVTLRFKADSILRFSRVDTADREISGSEKSKSNQTVFGTNSGISCKTGETICIANTITLTFTKLELPSQLSNPAWMGYE